MLKCNINPVSCYDDGCDHGYLLSHLPGLLLQLQDDLVAGAAVGASSGGAVLLPALQTDPAEVVLALARRRQTAESVTTGARRI